MERKSEHRLSRDSREAERPGPEASGSGSGSEDVGDQGCCGTILGAAWPRASVSVTPSISVRAVHANV